MQRPSIRTRRLLALLIALAAAVPTIGLMDRVSAVPAGEDGTGACDDPTTPGTVEECETTTSSVTILPTTEPPTTTTTFIETTTTTFQTTTTFRSTPTTFEETTTSSTSTTLTSTTNLLVPGDGSEGSESTTTTELSNDDEGVSESTLVWLIITGLLIVAAGIGYLTYRYWRSTAPVEPAKRTGPTTGSTDATRVDQPVGAGATSANASQSTKANQTVATKPVPSKTQATGTTSVFRDP